MPQVPHNLLFAREAIRPVLGVGSPTSSLMAAGDTSSGGGPGENAAAGMEAPSMQHPILTPLDGDGIQRDGQEVLVEVFDVIRRSLPDVPPTDPYRPVLSWFLTQLGPRLGRPELVPVPESRG